MTSLSVNINKVATLRNARGENVPDVQLFATRCEQAGADGITVHPRPDERHIRRDDVYKLRPLLTREFNIEGYPSAEFMQLVLQVKPTQVTLVPDKPEAITSTGGWDVSSNLEFLSDVVSQLRNAGIRSSIFVEPDPDAIRRAAQTGTDRVELYTKPYADRYPANPAKAIDPYVEASHAARAAGLGVNAGHDLNLDNLAYFAQKLPWLDEVSIGQAIVADALYLGLAETIRRYKEALVH